MIKEKQQNLQKLQTIIKTNVETNDKVLIDSLKRKKLTNSLELASEGGSTSNGLLESVKAVNNTGSSCDGGPISIGGSELSGSEKSVNRFESSGDGGPLKKEKLFIDSGLASDGELTSNLQSEIASLTEKIEKLEDKMNNLETLVYNIDFDLDCLEQYSRRNCLLLHGSYERDLSCLSNYNNFEKHIINVIKNHTGCSAEASDIDITHVMRNVKNDKRSVIIKFVRRSVRNAVFSAKTAFKNTKLMIAESLTKRKNLLNEVRLKFGNYNAWSLNGEIYADNNGKKFHIQSRSDIEQFL